MRCRQNSNRPARAHWDTKLGATSDESVADGAYWMRPVWMAVRLAPWIPGWTRNRNLLLQEFVVRLNLFVSDRPVRANAIAGIDFEIGRMKARGECSPMDGSPANSFARVVVAQS